jgi:hypothetical protein
MSKYDTASIKTFDNEVLETKLENQLITKLDMNQFITLDNSLTEAPGMTKRIRTYVGTGQVDEVAMGEGNTHVIGSEYSDQTYEVGTTQGKVPFYDEQQMNDPVAIDKAIQHLAESMVNDITVKVVGELRKGVGDIATLDFSGIVDAIAEMPDEDENDMYLLMNKKGYATIQKACKDELKYVEAFVRRGYVGTLAGVPIYVSKAIDETSAQAFLACRSAITCFRKKGVETEQERDADTRKTTIYGRDVKVIAITDATKVFRFAHVDKGYTLLAEQPEDWATKYYTDYYQVNAAGTAMEKVPQGTGAPSFTVGKYYSKNA